MASALVAEILTALLLKPEFIPFIPISANMNYFDLFRQILFLVAVYPAPSTRKECKGLSFFRIETVQVG